MPAAAPRTPARSAPAAPPPRKPDPPYIAAAKRRRRIPFWAMPVVGLLPLWAYMYARGLEPPAKTLGGPLGQGQPIYASKCSSCHGANGEGGVGYPLAGGEVVKSFDKINDHISFVYTGNKPYVRQAVRLPAATSAASAAPAAPCRRGARRPAASSPTSRSSRSSATSATASAAATSTSPDYLNYCAPDAPNFALVESGGFAAANIPIKLNG